MAKRHKSLPANLHIDLETHSDIPLNRHEQIFDTERLTAAMTNTVSNVPDDAQAPRFDMEAITRAMAAFTAMPPNLMGRVDMSAVEAERRATEYQQTHHMTATEVQASYNHRMAIYGRSPAIDALGFRTRRRLPAEIKESLERVEYLRRVPTMTDAELIDRLYEVVYLIEPIAEWELSRNPVLDQVQLEFRCEFRGDREQPPLYINYQDTVFNTVTGNPTHQQEIIENYRREALRACVLENINWVRNKCLEKVSEHISNPRNAGRPFDRISFEIEFVRQYAIQHYNFVQSRENRERSRDRWAVAQHMFHDHFVHRLATKKEKPAEAEKFQWMIDNNVPESVELEIGGHVYFATRIDDTMKVWKEANFMGNCLYNVYTSKMEMGNYIAFHIKAKHLSKSGFTLGMQKKTEFVDRCVSSPDSLDAMAYMVQGARQTGKTSMANAFSRLFGANAAKEKGAVVKVEKTIWTYDQLKGKANSINNDKELAAFCKHVVTTVQGVYSGNQIERAGV